MKRIITLLLALSLSVSLSAADLSWSPALEIDAGYKADGLQDYTASSFYAGIGIDPLSLLIDGRHNISLPFSVSYSTVGNEVDYERKQDEVIFGLEARYSYRFTELFSLGAGAGIKCQWHQGTSYLSASAGGSLIPSFSINDWFELSVPISAYGSRNDWSLAVGVGCVFRTKVDL